MGVVDCANGQSFPADFVVIGIGLVPNTELAEKAGLNVDDGIVVDEASRSSDPDIYAIGDCAMHAHHGFLQPENPPRIGSQRARTSPRGGRLDHRAAHSRSTAPWFWSDQYDLKLQMVGLSDGYDELVIRGKTESSSFTAFYLKEGRHHRRRCGQPAWRFHGRQTACRRADGDCSRAPRR